MKAREKSLKKIKLDFDPKKSPKEKWLMTCTKARCKSKNVNQLDKIDILEFPKEF